MASKAPCEVTSWTSGGMVWAEGTNTAFQTNGVVSWRYLEAIRQAVYERLVAANQLRVLDDTNWPSYNLAHSYVLTNAITNFWAPGHMVISDPNETITANWYNVIDDIIGRPDDVATTNTDYTIIPNYVNHVDGPFDATNDIIMWTWTGCLAQASLWTGTNGATSYTNWIRLPARITQGTNVYGDRMTFDVNWWEWYLDKYKVLNLCRWTPETMSRHGTNYYVGESESNALWSTAKSAAEGDYSLQGSGLGHLQAYTVGKKYSTTNLYSAKLYRQVIDVRVSGIATDDACDVELWLAIDGSPSIDVFDPQDDFVGNEQELVLWHTVSGSQTSFVRYILPPTETAPPNWCDEPTNGQTIVKGYDEVDGGAGYKDTQVILKWDFDYKDW